MIRKTIKGGDFKSQMVGELVFDQVPEEGSFNPVTSDAVAKIASDVAGVQEDMDAIEGKIPSDASSANKLVSESGLQDAIDNASESWSTGFTPKGESSVSDLNDLTAQSNGDSYIVTDSGTLTDGSLAVVAGDQVAWDATNSVWYKLPRYALAYSVVNVKEAPKIDSAYFTDVCTMSASTFAYNENKAWDVSGNFTDNALDSCSQKFEASSIKKVVFTVAPFSIIMWYEDGSVSYIYGVNEFIPAQQVSDTLSKLKEFAVNYRTANMENNFVYIEKESDYEKSDIELASARGSCILFNSQDFFESPYEQSTYWDPQTGESSDNKGTGLVGSLKFLISKFKTATFTAPVHSAIFYKEDETFDVIYGQRMFNLRDYSAYKYVCFNMLRSIPFIAYFNEDVVLGQKSFFDAISCGNLETVRFSDTIVGYGWSWGYNDGDFLWAGTRTGSKKFTLSDFDFIEANTTPFRVYLWREDGTFNRDFTYRRYDCDYYASIGFKYIALVFDTTDVNAVTLTLKKKALPSQNIEGGYYYKPKKVDVGSIDDITTLTSDDFCERYYDSLVTKYPDYVTKQTIGKDASNTYDMYVYEFTPAGGYEYSVYMQGGVHGMPEQQGYAGLGTLMRLIADADEKSDPLLAMVRSKVRLIVVPIVNVWAVSQQAKYNAGLIPTPPSNAAFNSNGINLNRNWFTDPNQQEIANIKTLISGYTDIVFGFDCHTDPNGIPGWGSYLLEYANNQPEFWGSMLKRVCSYLFKKNPVRLTNNVGETEFLYQAYEGDSWNYPISDTAWKNYVDGVTTDYERQNLTTTCCNGFWSLGILGATLEHHSNGFGTNCNNAEMVAAVELYGNQLIEAIRCNTDTKLAVHKLQNP